MVVVLDTSFVDELLPRKMRTNIIMNIAAPTTQTQGSVYHVVVVVVVVLVTLVEVLS